MGGLEIITRTGTTLVGEFFRSPLPGIGAWILSGVFLWSGLAKLRRPSLAAMALLDFGAVRRFDVRLGFGLACAELVLAAALALAPTRLAALAGSTVVLWFFGAAILLNLMRGRRFACFCFGDSDEKLSRRTFVRSIVLAMLSSAVLLAPSSGALSLRVVVLQIVAAVAVLLVIQLYGVTSSLAIRPHDHGGSSNTPARAMSTPRG